MLRITWTCALPSHGKEKTAVYVPFRWSTTFPATPASTLGLCSRASKTSPPVFFGRPLKSQIFIVTSSWSPICHCRPSFPGWMVKVLWAGSLVSSRERGDGKSGVSGQAVDSSRRRSSSASSVDNGSKVQKPWRLWWSVAGFRKLVVEFTLHQSLQESAEMENIK